jgi:glycosyltransferase involved in cell wall biosynthesis
VNAVVVSHPHAAAFAVGVAQGLARAGELGMFATGVAFAGGGQEAIGRLLGRCWPVAQNRLLPEVPRERLRALAPVELAARALGAAARTAHLPVKTYDAMFVLHDAATGMLRWPPTTRAVYAYEDGALLTFRRARHEGLARIWDLPLPHYRAIAEILDGEARRWPGAAIGPVHREPGWKQRRKDEELAVATHVSVASRFTKESLERCGIGQPIAITPYGFPVDEFPLRARPPAGTFRVVSVGTHDLRKGTPYLLEAWRAAELRDAELHIIGPLRLSKSFLDRYAGTFTHVPGVARAELHRHYASADVLLFPTLGDGFGMVIQEAMCTGVPVITTPCGGGPECITDGRDGWIVPPRDVDALVERLRACAADRDRTRDAGLAAHRRSQLWTWRDAGASIAATLEGWCASST